MPRTPDFVGRGRGATIAQTPSQTSPDHRHVSSTRCSTAFGTRPQSPSLSPPILIAWTVRWKLIGEPLHRHTLVSRTVAQIHSQAHNTGRPYRKGPYRHLATAPSRRWPYRKPCFTCVLCFLHTARSELAVFSRSDVYMYCSGGNSAQRTTKDNNVHL